MRSALTAAACIAALLTSVSNANHNANHKGETWVSVPRAGITIVVAKDGSRVIGPGWEHAFDAGSTLLDFEIAAGRRMVLRRDGDRWVGEYFHPRVRPGDHEFELHIMTFDRSETESP